MKKTFSLILMMCMACTTMFADNAKAIDKNVSVGNFEKVSVTGSPTVVYAQGDKPSVRIHGLAQDVEKIIVEVKGNKLDVRMKDNNITGLRSLINAIKEGTVDGELVVYVTSPDLTEAKVTGSGDFIARGKVDTDNLNLVITGSGDIKLADVICDNVSIEVTGSGDAEVGKLESVNTNVKITGSGDVEIKQQRVKKTTLNVYGSGEIKINCKDCEDVIANVSGSGEINISGEYKTVSKTVRGSGEVNERRY